MSPTPLTLHQAGWAAVTSHRLSRPVKSGGFYGDSVPRMGGKAATAQWRMRWGAHAPPRSPAPQQHSPGSNGSPLQPASPSASPQLPPATLHPQSRAAPPTRNPWCGARTKAPSSRASPRSRETSAPRLLRGLKLKPATEIITGGIHLDKRRWQTPRGSRAGAVICKDNEIHDKAQREAPGSAVPRYSSVNTFPF